MAEVQAEHGKATTYVSALDASIAETMAARPDLVQMQIENESIRSECRVRPRDLGRIREATLHLLEQFPALAERCIYTKNCGKWLNPDTNRWETKFASGLSIRAAEVLSEAYGYNRVRVDVIFPLDAERMSAKVEAVFVDLQNGRLWQLSETVSRKYMGWEDDKTQPKGPDGKYPRIKVEKIKDEDSFLSQTCKGAAAKLVRNCILACISPLVKEDFEEECRARMAALLDDKGTTKLLAAFKAYGVTQQRIEKFLGRTVKKGWTADDAALLRGIYASIRDGESTVDEAFTIENDEPADKPDDKPPAGDTPEPVGDEAKLAAFREDLLRTKVANDRQRKFAEFVKANPTLDAAAEAIALEMEGGT